MQEARGIAPSPADFILDEQAEGLDVLLRANPPDEVVGPSGRIYHDRSIFCLRPSDQPRRSAIYFVEWKAFDPIILITILCNCTSMAWESRPSAAAPSVTFAGEGGRGGCGAHTGVSRAAPRLRAARAAECLTTEYRVLCIDSS